MSSSVIAIGDKKELIILIKKPRSRYYVLACFGRRSHYRKDGTCKHTDDILAQVKPELRGRVKIDGWGGKPPQHSDQQASNLTT